MLLATGGPWFRRKARLGEAGIAGVELALALPMLILLMVGGFDFGRAIYEQNRLAAAAQAGVQYATESSSNWTSTSNIVAAARNDAGDTTNSLTVATGECTCPSGTNLCSAASTCTASAVAGTYVRVSVSESYSTLMNYPFMTSPITLTGQSTVRVQ